MRVGQLQATRRKRACSESGNGVFTGRAAAAFSRTRDTKNFERFQN